MLKKIIISLPEELLAEVDAYCKKFNYNRSEFIRHAMRKLVRPELKTDDEKPVQ